MKSNCFVLIAVSLLATTVNAAKPGSSTIVASQRKKAPLLKASHAGSLEQAVELRAASSGGSATMSTSVANLFKAIVGSGVLSLPVGIAAFSTSPSALKIALGMMAVIGVISAYCFTMVGRVVEATGTNTWGEAWGVAVGEGSKWVPTSLVALLTASCVSAPLLEPAPAARGGFFPGRGLTRPRFVLRGVRSTAARACSTP